MVVSGDISAVESLVELAKEKGARRALVLPVDGAFHSPLMMPAQEKLRTAIMETEFKTPVVPVYQNVSAKGESDPETIKSQLIQQLTSPVRWTQTMKQMIADGTDNFIEVGGKGRILSGLVRRLDRQMATESV